MDFRLLATDFFHKFSRAEFVLKSHGYYNDKAEADWLRFADESDSLTLNASDAALIDAISYLMANPPKKQVVNSEGGLEFKACQSGQNTQSKELSVYLRRIRNNLFHGGKVNGTWFDPDRRELLLKHGITVIETYMKHSSSFSDVFSENY